MDPRRKAAEPKAGAKKVVRKKRAGGSNPLLGDREGIVASIDVPQLFPTMRWLHRFLRSDVHGSLNVEPVQDTRYPSDVMMLGGSMVLPYRFGLTLSQCVMGGEESLILAYTKAGLCTCVQSLGRAIEINAFLWSTLHEIDGLPYPMACKRVLDKLKGRLFDDRGWGVWPEWKWESVMSPLTIGGSLGDRFAGILQRVTAHRLYVSTSTKSRITDPVMDMFEQRFDHPMADRCFIDVWAESGLEGVERCLREGTTLDMPKEWAVRRFKFSKDG